MKKVKLLEIQHVDTRMNFMQIKIQKQVLISLLFLTGMLCFSACNTNEITSGVTTVCGKSFVDGLGDVLDGTLQTAKMNKPVWLTLDTDNTIYVVEEFKGVRSVSEKENKVLTPYRNEGSVGRPRTIDFSLDHKVMYLSNDQWDNNGPGITVLRRENDFATAEVLLLTGQTNAAVVNPIDGEIFYNRYGDGVIFRYDKDLKEPVEQFQIDDKASELSFCFTPDGKTLYIICRNRHYIAKADYDFSSKTLANAVPFAGKKEAAGSLEGDGTQARLNQPCQTVCDAAGNLYVADCNNHCIRKVTPEGSVTTYAGIPGEAGYLDGKPLETRFNAPEGLALTKEGVLYVADSKNHCIRKIN